MTARQRPLQARLYAWAVVLLAVAGFAASARSRPPFTGRYELLSLLLLALCAAAWRYPVQFAPKLKVYITSAATFAAVLLLPVSMAVAVAALGIAVGEMLNRRSLFQAAFNTAVAALGTLAAGSTLALLDARGFAARPDLRTTAVTILAAVVSYLVNAFLVETMSGLYLRHSVLPGLWERHRAMIAQRAALYLLGAFAALIGNEQPWALLVVALPGWVVYRSLRDGVALRSQTREAVEHLADIVDTRDRYTFQHSLRVGELSQALALRLGLGADQAGEIFRAARVHDVGKIGVRSTTLSKPAPMEEDEWEEMRAHSEIGARLISRFPDFATGREIVLHHHERWDGAGYPSGLKGTDIPIGARVVAVADTFDAMTSSRAYRSAMPLTFVLAELERCRGSQLDPRLVDSFFGLLREHPDFVTRTESGGGAEVPVAPFTTLLQR